ncbi:MAG: MFS transporter, partial [Limisphaerales bacterium]
MVTPTSSNPSSTKATGLFRTADGKNHLFTFLLICSLFLLWGCCSGLLDNLNKHFQNTLHLSKFQSGFVQWAFYMGYFLMALPAGAISRRFGYKGGILVGLTLAVLGAFWFIPATNINTYWA